MQKFELKPWNRGITDEEMLEDLRRVALLLDKASISQSEYDKHGRCSAGGVERKLGGWNNALSKAGLEVLRRRFSDEELFENLRTVWIRLGRQPTQSDMRDKPLSKTTCSDKAYGNRFGSWRKALERFVEWANGDDSGVEEEIKRHQVTIEAVRTKNPSERLRFRVMLRDNFKCQYCGKSPATHAGLVLHLDHRIPFSKGGETSFENLITACSGCNLGKSDMELA